MYAALMDRLVYVDLKVAVIWILSDWMLIILHCGKKKKNKSYVEGDMCSTLPWAPAQATSRDTVSALTDWHTMANLYGLLSQVMYIDVRVLPCYAVGPDT